ncbi:dihydroxyacetone kinase subunit DhaL [Phaeacidiphilus oryzae]|uniref:dihydroxyacetone kinase subunit DhaL n=1 Tax=Phaeacidiphilus oryzae TaxID=348818 RepID=UPI000563C631|nr:dihydroxyacetone kinase subunit DhaL [Phaeacidiphilus oryzae]
MTSPQSPALDTDFFLRWLQLTAESVHKEAGHLTELDSAIGDADHGANLDRGFTAVLDALAATPPDAPPAVLIAAGRQLVSKVGGASGPLYGTALRRAGKALGDEPTPESLGEALDAAVTGVQELGGAAPGDKTMVDALRPAADAYREAIGSGAGLVEALEAAAEAARSGAEATTPMQARKGRASYLGERSIGHQDPGATSSALLLDALVRAARGD